MLDPVALPWSALGKAHQCDGRRFPGDRVDGDRPTGAVHTPVSAIGHIRLLHATLGFRMGADCFPDDAGLAGCGLRTEAE
jgi:hypothetical protein